MPGASRPAPRETGGLPGAVLSRRAALRATGLAAASVLVGAAARAAAGASASPATAAASPIRILWRPWYNFNEATTKTGEALLLQGIQPWLAKNPGIDVQITFLGYQATTVAALLAGNGPDIFADWVLPLFTDSGLLLDLSPFVKQSNVNLGQFPARDMEVFQQNGGLWALPSYLHLEAPAVNLGILDNAGLSYPQPGWTYTQWTRLWEQTAVKAVGNKPGRVGGQFYFSGYDGHSNAPAPYYLKGFGGEYVNPADTSQCYLTSSGSTQAYEWIYGLLNSGVCNTGGSNFTAGGITATTADTAGGLITSAQSWRSLKWQIYDEPVYPALKTAFAASDFYAISAATARQDVVWDFMQYLCVGPDWQNWMVKLAMNGPNQAALYPQWEETVKAVAPPLANINLSVFTNQMLNNEPYFGLIYRYDDPQAGGIISSASQQIQKQQLTVPAGLSQANQQVNALEATAKSTAASAAAAAKSFPVDGRAVAVVPTGI